LTVAWSLRPPHVGHSVSGWFGGVVDGVAERSVVVVGIRGVLVAADGGGISGTIGY
jgi:hypothetical protein